MNKILTIFAAIFLLAAGCNTAVPVVQPVGPAKSIVPDVLIPTPTTQLYENATYNFQFSYPLSMVFVTPNYANLENKIVQLQISQNAYPKTNFGDAGFAVSETYAKSLTDCLAATNAPANSDDFKTKVSINGQDFYMTNSNEAGAGNLYQSKVYRAYVAQGSCIELDETIHTAQLANFTPGTVTAVDTSAVQQRLDSVLQSFRFN